MSNTDGESKGNLNFYERYSGYTDARIMEILRNQKDYQEAARNAAIQIAIERQLIHSELDLLAPEFQNSKSSKFSLFPSMTNVLHYNRLTGSVFRFLYVFTFLPVVYGVLEYAKGNINHSVTGICLAAVWFLQVVSLKRTRKSFLVFPLLGLLFLAGAYVAYKLATNPPVLFSDVFMLIIGLLLPAYFLLYARKLIESKPTE